MPLWYDNRVRLRTIGAKSIAWIKYVWRSGWEPQVTGLPVSQRGPGVYERSVCCVSVFSAVTGLARGTESACASHWRAGRLSKEWAGSLRESRSKDHLAARRSRPRVWREQELLTEASDGWLLLASAKRAFPNTAPKKSDGACDASVSHQRRPTQTDWGRSGPWRRSVNEAQSAFNSIQLYLYSP